MVYSLRFQAPVHLLHSVSFPQPCFPLRERTTTHFPHGETTLVPPPLEDIPPLPPPRCRAPTPQQEGKEEYPLHYWFVFIYYLFI